ncbi:hypothetical protein JHN63_15250 [Streptomyces sp. MBT65]|uniref:DUF6415 family natural product biosynthesis protein n=1 Tax=Streptomyces sp. MBT65 TaxID=1488395 RepID=UPI00190D686D|nr:DUF6415 family natural product biosynthesis protein [Streptomyces sp. MBT65]MBK3575145.1 hypothetical protein [Streptomyces sp. MBT65]
MRVAVAEMVGGDAQLPRWETVQKFAHLYRGYVIRLIPAVEELIARQPKDDVPSNVARVVIDEARRRKDEIEAVGLVGEVRRVKRLARIVLALCDHYENLGGTT